MIAEKHLAQATAEAVALAQQAVVRCRDELATATHALEIARLARDALDESKVNLVVIGDESVRLAFRNRGLAADRLERAQALLAHREREATS